jgi:hypothetical protein
VRRFESNSFLLPRIVMSTTNSSTGVAISYGIIFSNALPNVQLEQLL